MIFNKRGFTLVEILIVLGLIGGMALIMMRLTEQSSKQIRHFESSQEVTSILSEIRNVMSEVDNCKATFLGANAKNEPNAATHITYENPLSGSTVEKFYTKSADPTASYGNGNVKIVRYELSDSEAEVDVDIHNTTHLNIIFDRGSLVSPREITKKLPLYVNVDASDEVIECKALGGTPASVLQDLCNSMEGRTWDDPNEICELDLTNVSEDKKIHPSWLMEKMKPIHWHGSSNLGGSIEIPLLIEVCEGSYTKIDTSENIKAVSYERIIRVEAFVSTQTDSGNSNDEPQVRLAVNSPSGTVLDMKRSFHSGKKKQNEDWDTEMIHLVGFYRQKKDEPVTFKVEAREIRGDCSRVHKHVQWVIQEI